MIIIIIIIYQYLYRFAWSAKGSYYKLWTSLTKSSKRRCIHYKVSLQIKIKVVASLLESQSNNTMRNTTAKMVYVILVFSIVSR